MKHRIGQTALRYVLAGSFGTCAIGARYALDPWLGDSQSLSLLFAAVALTIWICGLGPAIVLAALGYLVSDFLFIPPRGMLAVVNATEAVALGTYLVACAAIIGFGHGMRRAQRHVLDYASRLEASKSELEQAHRRKDDFLAILAHELRSPLAPIRTALALMIPRDPELTMAREVIERQSRHLQRLVDDLSDLSRIRAGKFQLEKTPTPLHTVLGDAIEISQPKLIAARHALTVQLPEEPLLVNADATRLTQVFANLLNNASRYTPERGSIRVELRREAASAVVAVTDNGIGVPADMLTKIFDLYQQGDAPAERSGKGLGIGLALASRFVWLHGGSIEAFSAGEGKGSTFSVRLPLVPVAQAERPAVVAAIDLPRRRQPEVPSVLIISSRADFVEVFATQITGRGFKVHAASSEPEVLRVGARAQPCAVVMDLEEDGADANHTCRALRQTAWGASAFVVGLRAPNGSSRNEAAAELLDMEACDSKEAMEAMLRTRVPRSMAHQAEGQFL